MSSRWSEIKKTLNTHHHAMYGRRLKRKKENGSLPRRVRQTRGGGCSCGRRWGSTGSHAQHDVPGGGHHPRPARSAALRRAHGPWRASPAGRSTPGQKASNAGVCSCSAWRWKRSKTPCCSGEGARPVAGCALLLQGCARVRCWGRGRRTQAGSKTPRQPSRRRRGGPTPRSRRGGVFFLFRLREIGGRGTLLPSSDLVMMACSK